MGIQSDIIADELGTGAPNFPFSLELNGTELGLHTTSKDGLAAQISDGTEGLGGTTGAVGEIVQGTSSVPPDFVTATPQVIDSISLTAGIWLVTASCTLQATGIPVFAGTTANLKVSGGGQITVRNYGAYELVRGGTQGHLAPGTGFVALTSTSTIDFEINCTFTVGQVRTPAQLMWAMRVR